MMDVTSKLLIFDADNGGELDHLQFLVRSERSGVSAMILEDKIGLKKIHYFKSKGKARQTHFCKKLKNMWNTQSNNFLAIARTSFIVGKSLNDALKRAEHIPKLSTILIHSKENSWRNFKRKNLEKQIFYTFGFSAFTYSKVYEKDLVKNGFKIVIYANQLLRAAYPSMNFVAKKILENGRAYSWKKTTQLKK